MEKEFIPYEQALALKELGFDKSCLAQYKKYDVGEATLDIGFSKNEIISKFDNLVLFCSTPLYQQVFRWFREKYNIHCETFHNPGVLDNPWSFSFYFMKMRGRNTNVFHGYETYEEAELECLKKLIEIVKQK
jgi:hypothetical protein